MYIAGAATLSITKLSVRTSSIIRKSITQHCDFYTKTLSVSAFCTMTIAVTAFFIMTQTVSAFC